MFGEIALIELIIGGAIGTAMGQFPSGYRYVKTVLKGDLLLGRWYHHFINRDDHGSSFRVDEMMIERGYRKSIRFSRAPRTHGGDKYYGYITREANFIIAICWAEKDNEFIVQRYKNTPLYGRQFLVSLSLAQNYKGQASVNPTVLSRDEIKEDEFLRIVKEAIRVDASNRVMYIE